MIHVAAKYGNLEKAEQWMSELHGAGLVPNAICYNAVLHACVIGHAPARAEHWMQQMKASGLQPNVTSYNAMIDACTG
eukprot:CAMPEP_0171281770 /NCGR_PEP_ID=MMETSP0790-20130122/66572_1 /TAXON_ID=2925 /ORGANISM="Alexandrium catenella, Strain OF101" /LENGTH=77 /DNA_ID=CAMNT_0011751001 /DNA_START=1 /DNA_END=230 /DNA_ORIENTATION=-